MDYDEYEGMVKLIKKQKEVIDEIKKSDRVVFIDNRKNGNSFFNTPFFDGDIPEIIGNEELAKEFLQKEFNDLQEQLREASDKFYEYRENQRKEKFYKEEQKPSKKPWWKF